MPAPNNPGQGNQGNQGNPGPPSFAGGENDFNQTAVNVLLQRVQLAKAQGAVNIVVNVDFLSELLSGSGKAMQGGWKSQFRV